MSIASLVSLIVIALWLIWAYRNRHLLILHGSVVGPRWEFPDGHLLSKFLRGPELREAGLKYGPVYKIWSLFTPEMYDRASYRVLTLLIRAQSHYHSQRRKRFLLGLTLPREVLV